MIWLTRDKHGIALMESKVAPQPRNGSTGEFDIPLGACLLAHFYDSAWQALGLELPEMNSCQQIQGLAIKKGGE